MIPSTVDLMAPAHEANLVGVLGFAEVRDTIAREKITAMPDAQEIGVNLEPGEPIDTGAEAKSSRRSSGRWC
jgi:hypothetical protein